MTLLAASSRRRSDRFVVFEDHFTGATLGADWTPSSRSNNPNGEEQVYTPRTQNVRVEDSALILEMHREEYGGKQFTSGRVDTSGNHAFLYGRFEARMKCPLGTGLWPAFWTLGNTLAFSTDENGIATVIGENWPACGEIDIHESTNTGTSYLSAVHYGSSASFYQSPIDRTEWHTYRLDWTPEQLAFSYDDNEPHWTVQIGHIVPFHRPHYLILNLAVGGGLPGPTGVSTPDAASLLVDWVRVSTLPGQPVTNPAGVALSQSTAVVAVGQKVRLAPSVTPSYAQDQGIAWTSSNPGVAIVGGSYVTGVSAGAATITATTWNGLSASCEVTVTDP